MTFLAPASLPAAIETLVLAFDDDPMFRYALPPAEGRRRAWLRLAMGAALAQTMPEGHVLAEARDGAVDGVIGLEPPGRRPGHYRRIARFILSRRCPSLPFPSLHTVRALIGLLRLVEQHRLPDPHWYVQVLGVHPSRQGTGVGRRLLSEALARADRDRVPAYLETTKASNLTFYRRFGFEVRSEHALPGGSPPLWTMVRRVA